MIITLSPGEKIRVELQDSDGAFEVEFGYDKLTVWADLPGSIKGDAGVIYEEDGAMTDEEKAVIAEIES